MVLSVEIPIIIVEDAGLTRDGEPVTVGVPLPRGLMTHETALLHDPDRGLLPLQSTPLAFWPDESVKWLLLDFQASVSADSQKTFFLRFAEDKGEEQGTHIAIEEHGETISIDTGQACFSISTSEFKPFSKVVCGGHTMLSSLGSSTELQITEGEINNPLIKNYSWETRGQIRSTLLLEGVFPNNSPKDQLSFIARLTFYAGRSDCKIEFTLWNPHAATHPGGLWDLGDPGSIHFQDLSICFSLNHDDLSEISWKESLNAPENKAKGNFQIYQDSSGGENWRSLNHVNEKYEVCTSFRGYRVFDAGKEMASGHRATPSVSVGGNDGSIGVMVKDFWQNFPKALEADQDTLTVRLFPGQYNDRFEIQGGERKTHTFYASFNSKAKSVDDLQWYDKPLHVRSTPECYAASSAIAWLSPASEDNDQRLHELLTPAIKGENTFFDRREIIDEYGWRNFGEWYADHEAAGYEGDGPLIAHYNNQYDGIYGTLMQYLKSGDKRWFLLADQLSHHVRDIDIYHTEEDRPEYNKGLFWHTEHYIDVQTASHRCFSKRHGDKRNLACYGGGPALAHNYATGFLYHYYLTGERASKEAVIDLAEYVENALAIRNTLSSFSLDILRKAKGACLSLLKGQPLVDFNKVYSTDGPGRGGANAFSTLMTAYELTGDRKYLLTSERLMCNCVHPDDDLDKMGMLDPENRWMYTIFLQAIAKYLDIKRGKGQCDQMFEYGRQSLLQYARWMAANEYLYLDKPENLEFPNETWAAQEIRKCTIFLYAALYGREVERPLFQEKAEYFYQGTLKQMQDFDTKEYTRPITILLQNSLVHSCFESSGNYVIPWFADDRGTIVVKNNSSVPKVFYRFANILRTFSLSKEIRFLLWRLKN